jgi:hypothetical protein
MEDVLDVYERPFNPHLPQVCLDELHVQLVGETRTPLPAAPGRPARIDYEYVRNGSANLFLWVEPLAGRRQVRVTERRTKQDWALVIRDLIEVQFPDAERIVLVVDNLNTHVAAALYEAFPAAEARRLWQKLEVHYTPKHGSWLNMAEIELGILSGQCLRHRIPDIATLICETTAWEQLRNARTCPITWRFTAANARIKLHRLYPSL